MGENNAKNIKIIVGGDIIEEGKTPQSKYTKELVESIIGYLENGMTKKDAAILAGITEETFCNWQRPFMPDGKTENKQYHPEFSELVEKALATYRKTLITAINIHSIKRSPMVALEILSRRWPNDWAGKQKIEIETGNDRIQRVLDLIEESKKGEQVSDNSK